MTRLDSIAPCPQKPNCVSTLATDAHAIAPIPFRSTPAEAMQTLLAILKEIPRTTIVFADESVVRAEFRTLVFRFVDDGVFVVDEESHAIHFRSAARTGTYDFGVNRKRMETIRARFQR